MFTWRTAWVGCFFYSILGALSCVLQLCVLERCTYSHTRLLLWCLSYISTSGPSGGPQLSTWSAATTTPILAKLFDLNMIEAVSYMHTSHQYWLQLCHQLTLEVFLQELPRLTMHPTLPHFLHLPETQYFRWTVLAEHHSRWWMRCGLTHTCNAVRTEPSVLPSAAVFRCLLVCFSERQSSALHSGSWHSRAATEGSVCLCVWGGDCSKFQMACQLATCGINRYTTNGIILKLCV